MRFSGRIACVLLIVGSVFLLVSCAGLAMEPQEIIAVLVDEYKIVYPSGSGNLISGAAGAAKKNIAVELDGKTKQILIGTDKTGMTGKEILVGSTNRQESLNSDLSGLGPLDYRIQVFRNGNITVNGGTATATAAGIVALYDMIAEGTIKSLREAIYTYVFWDHNEHDVLSDRSSKEFNEFVLSWNAIYSSPQWGGFDRDLGESVYALSHAYSEGNGRIATFAHRGDMANFPENSTAALISSVMSGADSVELDFRLTKDYVPVLIHDNHLQRVTNYNDVNGKNGLPTSVFVSDWTYSELRQLNLLDYDGNVTEYRIVSLYDAMQLCANVTQFSFDDKDKTSVSYDDEYYAYAEATGSWASLIWAAGRTNDGISVLREKLDDSLYDRISVILSDGSLTKAHAFYNDEVFDSWNNDYITMNEDYEYWDYLLAKGKRFIGTNQIYSLSLYMRDRDMGLWVY